MNGGFGIDIDGLRGETRGDESFTKVATIEGNKAETGSYHGG